MFNNYNQCDIMATKIWLYMIIIYKHTCSFVGDTLSHH